MIKKPFNERANICLSIIKDQEFISHIFLAEDDNHEGCCFEHNMDEKTAFNAIYFLAKSLAQNPSNIPFFRKIEKLVVKKSGLRDRIQ